VKTLLAIIGIGFATTAHADFDAASYPPYERCALCHGLFGESHLAKFPHLGGQKVGYIRAQLDAFLSGARTNDGGQMSAIVTELKPEEIPIAVAWFAEQDPPNPADPPSDELGKQLSEKAGCFWCHTGDTGDDVPHLTAQHAGYLAKQMRDFRDGKRTHSTVAEVHLDLFSNSNTSTSSDTGTDAGIDAIAAYLSSLERTK
jgi:cytochrome c553